jgi:hypothetical protein
VKRKLRADDSPDSLNFAIFQQAAAGMTQYISLSFDSNSERFE